MEQRISLVTLGVTNLARARAFYEAMGWRGAQQPDSEVAFFQAGGMVFGLWAALGGHGAPGVELAYNVRTPVEVDAVLAEAKSAGGSIVRPAAQADWGGYTVDETALRHGAGVEQETTDPEVAYGRFPGREPSRYREGWLPQ